MSGTEVSARTGLRNFGKGFAIGVVIVLVVWGICLALGLSFATAVIISALGGMVVSIAASSRARRAGAGPV